MAFNINDFRSEVNKVGLSVNNLFVVEITLPNTLQTLMLDGLEENEPIEYSRMLTFLCRSAQIPSLDLQTASVQPEGYGNPHRRPSGMQFNQLPMVFMVDSGYRTLTYFQRWMQSIVNYDSSIPNSTVDGRKKFFMEYKENYEATINVTMYSYNSGEFTFEHSFAGAFPTNVGEISLAWENQAEVMLLPVTFTFDRMLTSGMKQGQRNSSADGGLGFLSRLSQLNTIGNALSSIRKPKSILDAVRQVDRLNTILDNF